MTNQKSNVFSLLLLLLIVAIGLFWFKPNWDEVSALQVTETAKATQKDALAKQIQELKDAQANLAGTSEINQATVLTAIPENYGQDQLINQIVDIAKKNDVNLSSISFSVQTNSQDAIKKSTISLSMTGSEADLLRLLRGLESNPRKLVVRNVTVQLGRTENLERANFNISMDAFYQKGI
ncbi:type 4a pilus biogenesis protein PilO [Candidatus Peregrinibacteria bacterium]|nr:type 4a pilus biogenesis protein PilO [Candidatus Peregrinibacteria bacterium]